jgi:hypothetical protein
MSHGAFGGAFGGIWWYIFPIFLFRLRFTPLWSTKFWGFWKKNFSGDFFFPGNFVRPTGAIATGAIATGAIATGAIATTSAIWWSLPWL